MERHQAYEILKMFTNLLPLGQCDISTGTNKQQVNTGEVEKQTRHEYQHLGHKWQVEPNVHKRLSKLNCRRTDNSVE